MQSDAINSTNETKMTTQTSIKTKLMILFLALITVFSLLPSPAHAGFKGFFKEKKSSFLKVNEAFQNIPKRHQDKVVIDFVVTPKHYLYKDRIKLVVNGKTLPVTFSKKATFVNDPEFGRVAVFQENMRLEAKIPKSLLNKSKAPFTLKWQGCAKAGLCYPPITEKLDFATLPEPAKQAQNTDAKKKAQ